MLLPLPKTSQSRFFRQLTNYFADRRKSAGWSVLGVESSNALEENRMKLFQSIAVMALATFIFAWAQIGPPIIIPNPQPPYSQLVSYLSLTGDQLQSLEQIQQQRIHAQQDIYKQIGDAQNQLNTVMKSASPDPLQVGQLTLRIRSLQQQVHQPLKPFPPPLLP